MTAPPPHSPRCQTFRLQYPREYDQVIYHINLKRVSFRVLRLPAAGFPFCFYEGRSIRDVIWTVGSPKRRVSSKCVSIFLSRTKYASSSPHTCRTVGGPRSDSSYSKCLLKDPQGATSFVFPHTWPHALICHSILPPCPAVLLTLPRITFNTN